MALGVNTATDYNRLWNEINDAFDKVDEAASRELERGRKKAAGLRDAILNNPDSTQAERDAAEKHYEVTEKQLQREYGEKIKAPRALRDAGLKALQQEARQTRVRVDRMLLCDHKLWKEARKHLREHWIDGRPIRPNDAPAVIEGVYTWAEFEAFLRHDRQFNELLIMTQAIGSELTIERVTKKLSEVAREIRRGKPHTHVSDVVYLRPEVWKRDPEGEEALRKALGAGMIRTEEVTIQSQAAPKCYPPRATAGPGRDTGLGIFAHSILAVDMELQLGLTRGADFFADDSFAGNINPDFVKFVLRNNPNMPPESKDLLRKTALARPDAVVHSAHNLEVEEFKSASPTGVEQGRKDVARVQKWMKQYGLPYVPGEAYKPPETIPIFTTTVADYPIDFYLQPHRLIPGLVTYEYCILADWLALTKTGVVRVIIHLLLYLLTRQRLPNPSPIGPPIQLPVPLPEPIPLPPRLPIPATLPVNVPASTFRGLRAFKTSNRTQLALVVDDELDALW